MLTHSQEDTHTLKQKIQNNKTTIAHCTIALCNNDKLFILQVLYQCFQIGDRKSTEL